MRPEKIAKFLSALLMLCGIIIGVGALSTAIAPRAAASVVGDSDPARLLFDPSSGETFFRGSMFGLGQLTLGNLQNYCAHVQADNRTWHLPTATELQPLANMLEQSNAARTPALARWRALTAPAAPGYILPTASAREYVSYSQNSHLYNVSAFKYEVMPSQFVSQLQSTTLMIIGPSAGSAPITDGEGGRFPIIAVCVASR